MPLCPKCGKEISYLKDYSKTEDVYEFWVDDDGDSRYTLIDSIPGASDEWECPECNQVLFTTEEDAKKFLKGG